MSPNATRPRLGLRLPPIATTPAAAMPRAAVLAPLPDPAAVRAAVAVKAGQQALPRPEAALRGTPAPAVPGGAPTAAQGAKLPNMARAQALFRELAAVIKGGWPEVVLPLAPLPIGELPPVLANGTCARLQKRLPPSHHARLRKAFGLWTQCLSYQRALAAADAVRLDLRGNPVAPVDDEAKATALRVIAHQGW